jgi:nucleosome binding factor SPN SPT16 subunit
MSFPLSLSFRSRIRQKTQEKIEEKQKRRVERMKKAAKIQKEQQQQQDSLNSSTNTCSPLPGDSSASVPIIKSKVSHHFFYFHFIYSINF